MLLSSDRSDQLLASALSFHEAGDLPRAESLYRQVLSEDPDNADALHLMGVIAQAMGQLEPSLALIGRAIQINPDAPHYHNNLGNSLRSQGEFDTAARHYREALRLKPDYAEAWNNLGNMLREQGKLADSVECFLSALKVRPDFTGTYCNLGDTLKAQGKLREAITSYQIVLRAEPQHAGALYGLADSLLDLGDQARALEYYGAALGLRPDLSAMLYARALSLEAKDELEGAATCYQAILSRHGGQAGRPDPEPELRQSLASAYKSLANLLKAQGRVSEAADAYRESLRLFPAAGTRICLATISPPFYDSLAQLNQARSNLETSVDRLLLEPLTLADPLKEVASVNFFLAYQGLNDREIQAKLCRLYRGAYAPPALALGGGGGQGRLKVGFISSFFHNHTIGKLNRGLIANLSRERFEVCVFSLGSHDDELAGRIRQDADRYIQLPSHDLAAMRERIAGENLDVLFYTDIGMDPATYFLAYSRLAPVQCVTWGHPDTTGIDTIDYFISSELLETEQSEQSYTESLVRLKSLPTYYYRPSPPPALKPRAHFGLDEESRLYLCPQSLFKFHPDFDAALGGILRQDPAGRVVIIEGKFRNWTELLKERFRKTLPDVMERIVFLPAQNQLDFFSLLAVADVMLDPFHFGGGNSTYEGLALGVPIVSLPGEFMRGRVTGACYRKMGMTDCVASNPGEYVEIAVRLGTDKAYREQIKRRILASNAVLYEDLEAVRELERFFLRAVDVAKFP